MSALPTAQAATRVSPVSKPLAVPAFLQGLSQRGLSLMLDSTGEGLLLHGPKAARTDRIRAYIRANRPALLAHLKEQAEADRQAALIAEIGEELVAEGEAVEADLRRQQEEAAAPSFPLPPVLYHEDPATFWREWEGWKK